MKIVDKFHQLIRRVNYSQIKLFDINTPKIQEWCKENMPLVVKELIQFGWDLTSDDTWLETMFLNTGIKWYDYYVGLYVTSSMLDFKLANRLLKTKCFSKFRKDFGLDVHHILLLDNTIFLEPNDLDNVYLSMDFEKGYSSLDYSHFDENDELEEFYVEDWGWLTYDEDIDEGWSVLQLKQVYK